VLRAPLDLELIGGLGVTEEDALDEVGVEEGLAGGGVSVVA
jgi:hypothetical protein